jgi:Flp pilus assembly protein TadG
MNRFKKALIGLLRDRAGNAMLEFAIGASVMIAAFTGTFQFGYTFLQYNNLENAVIRGARFASVMPYDSITETPSAGFQSSVRNMVLYGDPRGGSTPALPGLTADMVQLQVTFEGGVPRMMTVSVSGYVVDAVFAITTFNMKPRITFPYQGMWTPV